VNMPMLYGEGERAFYRLQEEIIRQTEDLSFLLWGCVPKNKLYHLPLMELPVFAPRPTCFDRAGFIADPESCAVTYAELIPSPMIWETPGPWSGSSPPQMTSRGLRVSLPKIKQQAIDGKPQTGRQWTRHLVWTGFSCNNKAVCVPLVREPLSERYVRSAASNGWPRLHLLPAEKLRTMEMAEFYLSTSSTTWRGNPTINRLLTGPLTNYDFQAELSSTGDTAISLGASNPTLDFCNRTATRPQRAANRTTVWQVERVRAGQGFRPLNVEETNTLNISVVVSTTTQSLTQPTPKETVLIGMKLEFPPAHCQILGIKPEHGCIQLGRSLRSDRAEYRLQNGQILSAGIKFVTQRSDRRVFILRVAVLPRSLRPDPKEANATPRLNTADRLESWLQYGQPPGLGGSTRGICVSP
jgi:hypothetical protein